MMLRILDFPPDQPPRLLESDEGLLPPESGGLRWIDIEKPEAGDLDEMARNFCLHPLAIEDCIHFDQHPKIEEYGDHLFIVAHGFELQSDLSAGPRSLELHTFLGKDYLITVHDETLRPIEIVWERMLADAATARRGADFIRYLIADAMVDTLFPVIDQLADEIEGLEDTLLSRVRDDDTLYNIIRVKRLLVSLRRVLPAQRDVLAQLSKREEQYIAEKTVPYYRDVYDHLLRVNASIETNRELLGNVLDAHQWTVSQRTNDIVKRLTIVSAVFLPLMFITGFFGQNFEGLPFSSNTLMIIMLVSCAVVPAFMIWLFLRSKWL